MGSLWSHWLLHCTARWWLCLNNRLPQVKAETDSNATQQQWTSHHASGSPNVGYPRITCIHILNIYIYNYTELSSILTDFPSDTLWVMCKTTGLVLGSNFLDLFNQMMGSSTVITCNYIMYVSLANKPHHRRTQQELQQELPASVRSTLHPPLSDKICKAEETN